VIFKAAYLAIFLHFLRRIMAKMLVTPDDDRAVCYDAGSGTIVVLGRARVGAEPGKRGVFKLYTSGELSRSGRNVDTAAAVLQGMRMEPPGLDREKLYSLYQAMCVKYNRQEWCNDFVYEVYSRKR